MTKESLEALPGYTRDRRDSVVFTPCDDATLCPGGPFVEPPLPGWYRTDPGSLVFLPCMLASRCSGG